MPAYFDADNELDALMGPDETQAEHCCTPSDPCGTHAGPTPAERAERLIAAAGRQRAHERDLASRFGWR